MADQAFPDGDLAHPDRPNAYGPVQYPVGMRGMRTRRFENDASYRGPADVSEAYGQGSGGPADVSEAP
jgi:hypothetical protein